MHRCPLCLLSLTVLCVKRKVMGGGGLGAGNLIHEALAVKHVLLAPAFKIPWNSINFLPSQYSILSGKW